MKMIQEKDNSFISNNKKGNVCAIRNDSAVYQLLSDGLYSDKVTAVVRELCSNAYDSHVAAGKADVPFKVTIPTAMHHFFEVEDEGVGMDDHTVKNVFAGIFNSSKRNTNSEVGGFGLGSKTPFILNDNFHIRVRHNGRERHYTAYKQDSIPYITDAISDEPTTEHNGVKIIIPVAPKFKSDFIERIKQVIRWYDVTPVIVNPATIDLDDVHPNNIEVGHVGIVNECNCGMVAENAPIYLLMGCVLYPLSIDDCEYARLNKMLFTSRERIIVHAPIGAVDVTPSREKLSYSDRTNDWINSNVKKMCEDYIEHILDDLSNAPAIEKISYLSENTSLCLGEIFFQFFGNERIKIPFGDAFESDRVKHSELSDTIKNPANKTLEKTRLVIGGYEFKKPIEYKKHKAFSNIDIEALFNMVAKECSKTLNTTHRRINFICDHIHITVIGKADLNSTSVGSLKVCNFVAESGNDQLNLVFYLPTIISDESKAAFVAECKEDWGIDETRITFTTIEKEKNIQPKVPAITTSKASTVDDDFQGRMIINRNAPLSYISMSRSSNVKERIETLINLRKKRKDNEPENIIKTFTREYYDNICLDYDVIESRTHKKVQYASEHGDVESVIVCVVLNQRNAKYILNNPEWTCIDNIFDTITDDEALDLCNEALTYQPLFIGMFEQSYNTSLLVDIKHPIAEKYIKFVKDFYTKYGVDFEVVHPVEDGVRKNGMEYCSRLFDLLNDMSAHNDIIKTFIEDRNKVLACSYEITNAFRNTVPYYNKATHSYGYEDTLTREFHICALTKMMDDGKLDFDIDHLLTL